MSYQVISLASEQQHKFKEKGYRQANGGYHGNENVARIWRVPVSVFFQDKRAIQNQMSMN